MVRGRNTIPRRPESARRVGRSVLGALVAAIVALPGLAAAQSVRVTPTLDTELTWTDNVDTEEDGQQDWIAEISPGVSISRESGRFSGGLNMSLRNTFHAEQTEDNTTYLALNGQGHDRGDRGCVLRRSRCIDQSRQPLGLPGAFRWRRARHRQEQRNPPVLRRPALRFPLRRKRPGQHRLPATLAHRRQQHPGRPRNRNLAGRTDRSRSLAPVRLGAGLRANRHELR